jgi:hypothetical protein
MLLAWLLSGSLFMAQSPPSPVHRDEGTDTTAVVTGQSVQDTNASGHETGIDHRLNSDEPKKKLTLLSPGRHIHHRELEAELEVYPFNILVPAEPVIKNEVVIDYHRFSENEKWLGGARFFLVTGTHYRDIRETHGLLMYTEGYFGSRCLQLGGEVGSLAGVEYLSVGPQIAIYDNLVFKRLALISRVYPDYVLGYEFTTQEFHVLKNLKWSATGMCRYLPYPDERIFQFSSWFSLTHLEWISVGVEYEYHKVPDVSNSHSPEESPHELYLGVRFELQ